MIESPVLQQIIAEFQREARQKGALFPATDLHLCAENFRQSYREVLGPFLGASMANDGWQMTDDGWQMTDAK
jgi:hypothetical protein